MQVSGSAKHDWSAEAEWRIDGDVNLSAIPPGNMIALVADKKDEAAYFFEQFGIPTSAIG